MPSIKINNLTKAYPITLSDTMQSLNQAMFDLPVNKEDVNKGKIAVNNVSLNINEGERVGIIGRNGAGKSTLLQVLAGLTAQTSGTVEVVGKVTAVLTLGIGLREDLSGRENIYINGEAQGKNHADIDITIDEIIKFADIGEFIDYPVRTYSTGMKSRLSFSMLVCINPEILIIDEALSAGDAFFAKKASYKIREICDSGKIVLLVSHSMKTIVEMCNRCLWMEDGSILMDADPKSVTDAYLESIHQADEVALLEKYSRFINAASFQEGCRVVKIEMSYIRDRKPRKILISGNDTVLTMRLRVDAQIKHPDVCLKIMRLDGMLFVRTLLSESQPVEKENFNGNLAFAIYMTPLILGQGKYIVTCEILDRQEIVALNSIIIELLSHNNFKPALLYPSTIGIDRIDRE